MRLSNLATGDRFKADFYAAPEDTEPCLTMTGVYKGIYCSGICNVEIDGEQGYEMADLEVEKIGE